MKNDCTHLDDQLSRVMIMNKQRDKLHPVDNDKQKETVKMNARLKE